ncbi:unnamed protein product [Leuciscus chuanchicus]
MDSQYVNRTLGRCLSEALAEIIELRPLDPIEFLALWIRKYKHNQELELQRAAHQRELEEEKRRVHEENLHQRELEEEENRIRAVQKRGVRQGCSLSPTLFNIYINELAVQLEQSTGPGLTLQDRSIKLLLYADDLVLLSPTAQGLQQHLDLLENYCQNWALAVNLTKTNIMIFQKKPRCQEHRYQFSLGSTALDHTMQYTYLGLVITASGSFSMAVNALKDKARRALYAIKKKFQRIELPIPIWCKIFDSVIQPIALYGSERESAADPPERASEPKHQLTSALPHQEDQTSEIPNTEEDLHPEDLRDSQSAGNEADAPEADAPEADAPEADAPEADAPEADAPEADAPEADAPEADAPEADAPEADAPEENQPGSEETEGDSDERRMEKKGFRHEKPKDAGKIHPECLSNVPESSDRLS